MSLLYKRVTLVVADIERSLTVYRDILGFTVNYIKDSAADSYSYPVFKIPKEAKIRFGALDSPTQERTIGLTEVKGYELPKSSAPMMSASVIKVEDLEAVMKKIEALGLETTEPEMDSNEYADFKEQAFIDFDGHLVVLYELMLRE
ncbi:MAG: VOC family protein [Bacteroidota bacterium]